MTCTGYGCGGRAWSVPKPTNLLPLALSARAREAAGITVVEAAWLRTRLFPDRREDVAAYVVAPAERQIEITLPATPAPSVVEVQVDGSPVPQVARDDGDQTDWLVYYASDAERDLWRLEAGSEPPPKQVPAHPRALPVAPV